jgi:L-2-hydroxyglutarate oxidase
VAVLNDFIIIGGGIVGASTAMQLQVQYPDAKILLLEKEAAFAQHQTGHNSGVIHAGVYYKPGTLKAQFCIEGNRETKAFCNHWEIPFDECGKLLVATNELELERMKALWERTEANGLERYWVDRKELSEREPNIVGLEGIFVPSSGIVSYTKITQQMIDLFISRGGEVLVETEVLAIKESNQGVSLTTSSGTFEAGFVISCAGLMSDRIVRMLGEKPDFTICPFRGEYFKLPDSMRSIVKHMIYPIPDPATPFLGVHLTPMINGDLTVGPNAVLAFKREGYSKTDLSLKDSLETLTNPGVLKVLKKNLKSGIREMRNSLFKSMYLKEVQKYCPQISERDLLPYPAGVRAQAVSNNGELIDDFLFVATERTFNVCNAPSPAATSAIPIGRHIVQQIVEKVGDLKRD